MDPVDLRAGDQLRLLNGAYVVVEEIAHELLEAPVTVYNFEVADFHTYFVSGSAVLVHNSCSGKPTSTNQMQSQVRRNQAPKAVDRVDGPHIAGQQPHIHFKDGTSINMDGTIHDKINGIPTITKQIKIWLEDNGWSVK